MSPVRVNSRRSCILVTTRSSFATDYRDRRDKFFVFKFTSWLMNLPTRIILSIYQRALLFLTILLRKCILIEIILNRFYWVYCPVVSLARLRVYFLGRLMNIGRKALLYNETAHQTIWFVTFLSRIFVFVFLSLSLSLGQWFHFYSIET